MEHLVNLGDNVVHEYADGDHRIVVNGVAGKWSPYMGIAVNGRYMATAEGGSMVLCSIVHTQKNYFEGKPDDGKAALPSARSSAQS